MLKLEFRLNNLVISESDLALYLQQFDRMGRTPKQCLDYYLDRVNEYVMNTGMREFIDNELNLAIRVIL